MAVADAAVKPSPPPPPPPPPARIVVAVLAFLRFVRYLCFATVWVTSAATAAKIVARHACRKGSAFLVFLEAFTDASFKFYFCIVLLFVAIAALLLCGLCLAYLVAAVSGSGSEFKKRAFGAITWESAREFLMFRHAVVLGLVADVAFLLLSAAGILLMMMSPSVEGSISQGEIIGCVIMDVGIFGFHVISCFVMIPAFALHILRADRKAGLTVIIIC